MAELLAATMMVAAPLVRSIVRIERDPRGISVRHVRPNKPTPFPQRPGFQEGGHLGGIKGDNVE